MINPYWELVILLCLINIIFTVSLNLVIGFNGQFSLGHAAFLAIGAYTSGVVTTQLMLAQGGPALWHLFLGVALSLVISTVGAVLIGYPCLRLRGDYLAIATLGFAEIVRIVALALPSDKFGGATGMQSVPLIKDYITINSSSNGIGNLLFTLIFALCILALVVWGVWAFANAVERTLNRFTRFSHWRFVIIALIAVPFLIYIRLIASQFLDIFWFTESLKKRSFESQQWVLFLVFVIVVAVVTWLVRNYLNSLQGRAVVAIREDEIASTNLGLNCTWLKLQNFMLGSALAGLAGALTAHTLTLFRPLDFNFFKSVDVLLMVVLGGMGSVTGSFVGATLITVLPEALRFLGQWRLVIYSLVLILFMIFRPGGLLGTAEIGQLIKLRATRALGLDRPAKGDGDA